MDWFAGCPPGFSSLMGWGVKPGLALFAAFLAFPDVCESDVLVLGDDTERTGTGELAAVAN